MSRAGPSRAGRCAGRWLLLLAACRPTPAASPPALLSPPPAARVGPRVVIDSPSGRSTTVEVELARSPEEQQRGLMFRERLAPGAGMLFLFEDTSVRAFWMKDTLVPLDIIFVDAAGTVVGVVERAEPLTTSPRGVGLPSRDVLEVPGGFAAAHAVRAGDRVRYQGFDR